MNLRIKVGETTYDVNPSWATGNGGNSPIKMGTNGALTIGTAGLISMSTGVSIGNSLTVEGNIVCQQRATFGDISAGNGGVEFGANTIRIGSKGDAKVDIIGVLNINGVAFDPTAIPTSASIKGVAVDGDNLIIGTGDDIKNVYLGTNLRPNVILDQQAVKLNGTDIVEIGSIIGYQRTKEDGTLIIGSGACGKKQNVQVGLDDTNISVIGTKVSIKASTIDLPTATKLYFNGIPISKSGNALIFDDQNTELSLDSGWKLTKDKLKVDNIETTNILLAGSSPSLEGLESLSVNLSGGNFLVEDGRVLAMWSGYGIDCGTHDDGSESTRIYGDVEFVDNVDTTSLFKNTEELNLPVVNKMYFGHIPVTVIGTAGSYDGDGTSTINTRIQVSNSRYDSAFLVETGIQENDIKGSIGIGLGTYYGEPYMSCYSEKHNVANKVYVGYEALKIEGNPVRINDFQFDCDKENSKLIISYNNKKAEIQLT